MKNRIITLIAFLATVATAFAGEVNIIYLKNGSKVRGEIIEQIPDKSVTIETENGNIFVFEVNDIEKITKVKTAESNPENTGKAVSSQPVSSPSQSASSPKNAAQLSTPSTTELKDRMALNAPDLYKKYKSGSTLSSVGASLTLGGATAMLIGFAAADKETVTDETSTTVNLSGPGGVVFAIGLVSTVAGTPLWIVGHVKKKKAKNAHLREFGYDAHTPVLPSPHLQINPAPNGMGMAFVF